MRLPLLSVTALALLAATPAGAAAFLSTFIGPNSDSATQSCSGDIGAKSGSATVHASASCSRADVGTANGQAVAAAGHLGAYADADSHNGDSLLAKTGASAQYQDFLTFTSVDPTATSTTIAVNMLLDGVMQASGPVAGSFVIVSLGFSGASFGARFNLTEHGDFTSTSNFLLLSGAYGPTMEVALGTGTFTIPLNTPLDFRTRIETTTVASGPGGHASAAFLANSFKLAPTPFDLPDGVTVNAGDYIVDNRFIDPLAPAGAAPEPAAWALMIGGFSLAGAALRRRRALAT
jgi:hypothetical protein